jgi:hypothetical protein
MPKTSHAEVKPASFIVQENAASAEETKPAENKTGRSSDSLQKIPITLLKIPR